MHRKQHSTLQLVFCVKSSATRSTFWAHLYKPASCDRISNTMWLPDDQTDALTLILQHRKEVIAKMPMERGAPNPESWLCSAAGLLFCIF